MKSGIIVIGIIIVIMTVVDIVICSIMEYVFSFFGGSDEEP